MYQLNVKSIPRMGYDVIMLDEAQDINPVISEIIAVEVSCAGLIMVGDTHQQVSFVLCFFFLILDNIYLNLYLTNISLLYLGKKNLFSIFLSFR